MGMQAAVAAEVEQQPAGLAAVALEPPPAARPTQRAWGQHQACGSGKQGPPGGGGSKVPPGLSRQAEGQQGQQAPVTAAAAEANGSAAAGHVGGRGGRGGRSRGVAGSRGGRHAAAADSVPSSTASETGDPAKYLPRVVDLSSVTVICNVHYCCIPFAKCSSEFISKEDCAHFTGVAILRHIAVPLCHTCSSAVLGRPSTVSECV